MRLPSALWLMICLGIASSTVAAEAPLRFSISDSWSMPMANITGNTATEGIMVDLTEHLASHLGRSAEYDVLPPMRVQGALQRGDIDVRCYVSPDWTPEILGDYTWSVPLMTQRDIMVGGPGNPTQVQPEQLQNESIGTVLGYIYPTLQPLFDSHQLLRDDARSQDQVLKKLAASRYKYAITNQISLDWFNRDLPPALQLPVVSVIQEQPISCIVRNDPNLPVQAILRTLLRMKMSGEIEQIIQHYSTATVMSAQ